jgi:ligand-binding SRPBCC domain-containing protein
MTSFELTTTVWLDRPLEEVFEFFSEARNLEVITPGWLRFEVLTPEPVVMAAGTTIDYRLRWRGVPLRWTSEISAWDPPHFFVDRQIRGPYRLWHHEHFFADHDGGTRVVDRVRYAVPLGRWIQRLVVGRDVESIFSYRKRRLLEIFDGATQSNHE